MQTTFLTVILTAISLVGPLGLDTSLPTFPAIASEFKIDDLIVGQTLTVYSLAIAIATLFHGTISDSLGRRRVALVSLVVFALSSAAAMLAPSIEVLLLARALQGAVAGAGIIVARAIVTDCFDASRAHRAFAQVSTMYSIGVAVAPNIGGALQSVWGWRSVFGLLSVVGGVLALTCFFWLPETLPLGKRQRLEPVAVLEGYVKNVLHVRFMAMSLSISLVYIAIPLYVGSSAVFLLDVLKLHANSFAWLYVPVIGGMLAGFWVSQKYALRARSDRIVATGFGLMLFAAFANVIYNAIFTAAVPWAVAPLFVNALGFAICYPSMMNATLSLFPNAHGRAASMQGFMQMAMFALVSGLIAPVVQRHPLLLSLVHLGGLLVGIGIWMAVPVLSGVIDRKGS